VASTLKWRTELEVLCKQELPELTAQGKVNDTANSISYRSQGRRHLVIPAAN